MTEAEQIAAFLAAKGATKIPTGANVLGDMTSRDWAKAVRSTVKLNARDPISERHVVVDHIGREHVRNGLGEWIS